MSNETLQTRDGFKNASGAVIWPASAPPSAMGNNLAFPIMVAKWGRAVTF